jgi:hypothetical protein
MLYQYEKHVSFGYQAPDCRGETVKQTTILAVFEVCVFMFAAGCGEESPVIDVGDEPYDPVINPADFVAQIDNQYLPLMPGTTYIYEGESEDGKERIEVYVTDQTKEILGIACTIVSDRVWVDDKLVEDTLDWYAQDKDGNVWYFGEDSKEYEDGKVVSTEGSWEAGVDGAKPGIIMKADPQVGDAYRQEYYEDEAEDMAEVFSLNESVSVTYGSFDNCLKTKEWTPLEPDIVESKYYAPGVGVVLEVMVEGGSERAELVDITTE